MIVSFDLDDTLFVAEDNFKIEQKLKFPFCYIYKETLRKGTIELIKYLKDNNINVWVYTTSYRSERYIKGLFKCYGITFDNIINGQKHQIEVQAGKTDPMPSKYPGKYRIALHIDDDISVAQNGNVYGFKVFTVGEQDDMWVNKIIEQVEKIRKRSLNQ